MSNLSSTFDAYACSDEIVRWNVIDEIVTWHPRRLAPPGDKTNLSFCFLNPRLKIVKRSFSVMRVSERVCLSVGCSDDELMSHLHRRTCDGCCYGDTWRRISASRRVTHWHTHTHTHILTETVCNVHDWLRVVYWSSDVYQSTWFALRMTNHISCNIGLNMCGPYINDTRPRSLRHNMKCWLSWGGVVWRHAAES